MNELMIFENPEFGSIRTLEVDGQPYWVAIDVSKALGYVRNDNAVRQHCQHALKQGVLTKTGEKQTYIIPESDLYRLIVHSKLPSAAKFERWVFDEVLPTIRQTGTYQIALTEEQAEINAIKQGLSEIKQALVALTKSEPLYIPSSKAFIKTNTKAAYRKNYINYLLSALESTLQIDRMDMLHQAYLTIQNEAKINLDFVKQAYATNHGVINCSMLDAICSDETATLNLVKILHFNIELIITD